MANVLYLVHRLPYPPNKGDKVRSYHVLKHLAARHKVFLGTFVDDPDDLQHVETVRSLCADVHAARLKPRRARLLSLLGLLSGKALTLHYYNNAGLRRWVADTVASQAIDAVVVFSSSMAQYTDDWPALPKLIDLVDVDSAKWTEYANRHPWPLSWLYRLEGRRLLAYERHVVSSAVRSYLVTANEVALFRRLAPEVGNSLQVMGNGVDAEVFQPDPERQSPYAEGELAIVFTGAMDYWPNVDAVTWFVQDALPALRQRWPQLRLHIVGRSPTAEVCALAGDAVAVSGTVPDVRPYLQHAAVVVAPLRLARGVQNKVLEAMAMARPVVAASTCVEAIDAIPGEHLEAAADIGAYINTVDALLRDRRRADDLGHAARQRVIELFSWPAQLAQLDLTLNAACSLQPAKPPNALTAETL